MSAGPKPDTPTATPEAPSSSDKNLAASEAPTEFFLPIPAEAFYSIVSAVTIVIVVLIVAISLCCYCSWSKKKTQWRPTVQPGRTQVTNPTAIGGRGLRERSDRGATITTRATLSPAESYELPSKKGADNLEGYDDPMEMVEHFPTGSECLPPPPKYEELEF